MNAILARRPQESADRAALERAIDDAHHALLSAPDWPARHKAWAAMRALILLPPEHRPILERAGSPRHVGEVLDEIWLGLLIAWETRSAQQ